MMSICSLQRQFILQQEYYKLSHKKRVRCQQIFCSGVQVSTKTETQESNIEQYDSETQPVLSEAVAGTTKASDVDPSMYKYVKEKPVGVSGVLGGRGWGGGEKSLWDYREDIKGSTIKISAKTQTQKSGGTMKLKTVKVKGNKFVQAKVVGSGRDAIYVGFEKDEMDKKAKGQMGSYILDNAQKYPDKENVGILLGATGGFQGGEVGLLEYVETGDVLTPAQRKQLKKSNPVPTIAASLTFAAAAFGYFYTHPEIQQQIADKSSKIIVVSNTQLFLIKSGLVVGGGLLGVLLILSALSSLSRAVTQGAKNLVVFVAFWGGVAVFAKYLLSH